MSPDKILPRLLELAEFKQLDCGMDPDDPLHGIPHWKEVAALGAAIATKEKVDPLVAQAFGILHDCCRMEDGEEPEHGPRAANWIMSHREIKKLLGRERALIVADACEVHTLPFANSNTAIGSCLDADRLTLYRVGRSPKPILLSTASARDFANSQTGILSHGKPGFTLAYHGSNRISPGKTPSPQNGVLYTALDRESAKFYGHPITLFCTFQNLADLRDPMGILKDPIFPKLLEYSKDTFKGRLDHNGEPQDIFNLLEAGDLYFQENRSGQEDFIKEVLSWEYDAVLLQDTSHSVHPTLVLGPLTKISIYNPYK